VETPDQEARLHERLGTTLWTVSDPSTESSYTLARKNDGTLVLLGYIRMGSQEAGSGQRDPRVVTPEEAESFKLEKMVDGWRLSEPGPAQQALYAEGTEYYAKPAEHHPSDEAIRDLMSRYISPGDKPTWQEWRAVNDMYPGADFRLGLLYGPKMTAFRDGDWLVFRDRDSLFPESRSKFGTMVREVINRRSG